MSSKKVALSQWFTPGWAAEALVEAALPRLRPGQLVWEPSCGDGAFLKAIPDYARAVGVDIDPSAAAEARANTGREVLVGDFRLLSLPPREASAVIGNPPFVADIVSGFLQKSFELLHDGGVAAFILPAYMLQSPRVVVEYHGKWGMHADLLPRTLFPRLSLPLVFARFTKTRDRTLVGFLLFEETREVEQMPASVRKALTSSRGSVWRAAVTEALRDLGGSASLDAIYAYVEPRRPTGNQFWKDKIRQVLQTGFTRIGIGQFALSERAVAA